MAYTSVHLPVGYKVEIETTPGSGTFTDLGVTMNEGSLNFTYDAIKVTGSRAEGVLNFFKNMSLEASFSLLQQELSNIHKLMSGATAYDTVDGTPVAATDSYLANAWVAEKFYPFANQNGDGTVPASITVECPLATVLTNDTDYVIGQDGNGKWGIFFIDTVAVDPTKAMEINYTYTPSASRTLTAGSSSVDISTRVMKISKELDTGKWWTMTVYAAVNTSGLSFSLPRYDSDEPSVLEVTMTGQLDTTRSELDKLFSISDSFGVADI